MFFFTTVQCLFNDKKHFGKELDLSQIDPTKELFSENTKKAISKMKLESYPEIDLAEAIFLRSKSYKNLKLLSSIQTKHKGSQLQNKKKYEVFDTKRKSLQIQHILGK